MRSSAKWSLCLGLLVWLGAALPARAAVDGRAAAGRQLARTQRALAATAQAAKAPQAGLPRSGPFRATLAELSGALGRAEAGLRAGNASYFAALSDGSRSLAELEAVWARTPRRDAMVDARMKGLSTAYRRLRNGYGWEALRRGRGGALTAAEASRFRALQQADAQLAAHLKPVQAKVAKAGDQAMAEQLARLRDEARRVAAAELTIEAYLTAELLNDILRGEWQAAQHYVKKPYRATWKKSAPTIEKLATDPGVGFVFATDLSKAESWTFDDSGNAGGESAAADRVATPAQEKAAPAPRDETPVDEVEIVDGQPRRTEGVAPEAESSAEPGTAPPAAGEVAPPAAGDAPAAPTEPAPPATGETSLAPTAPSPSATGGEPTAPGAPAAEPAPSATGEASPPAGEPPAEPSPAPEPELSTAAPAPPDATAGEPAAPAPPADAPVPSADAPPAGAVDPGDASAPPAAEPGSGDPGTSQEMAPQDPDATAPPDAEPAPGDEPEVAPPATVPAWPGGLAPPDDPNAPDGGQPEEPPPSPPADDEPLPAEPPPPPPPVF